MQNYDALHDLPAAHSMDEAKLSLENASPADILTFRTKIKCPYQNSLQIKY